MLNERSFEHGVSIFNLGELDEETIVAKLEKESLKQMKPKKKEFETKKMPRLNKNKVRKDFSLFYC